MSGQPSPRIEHALQRLHERYGIRTGPWIIDRHERLIRSGDALMIGRAPLGPVFMLMDDGQEFYFACDTERRIRTYLTGSQAHCMAADKSGAAEQHT